MKLNVQFSENAQAFNASMGEIQRVTVGNVEIDLEETADGVMITAKDADGEDTAIVRHGKDGQNGKDGQPGKDGQNGYTPVKGVDYFDGKDGSPGKDGQNGRDGYTPVKGVDYFDGKDGQPGKDGSQGEKGDPGYTPVRGTDYWTDADKAEMVSAVIAALPVYNGEVADE